MHELKELSSFHLSLLKGFLCTTTTLSSRCWAHPMHHRFTYFTGFSEGLVIWGVAPTSAVRILVDLCLKSDKRNQFKEQMPSSGSLKCGSQLRNQSIPFYWKKKNCYQVVSVVSDALSAQAKRTKLLSAFSSQKRVAFVLIWKFVYQRFLRLVSYHPKI